MLCFLKHTCVITPIRVIVMAAMHIISHSQGENGIKNVSKVQLSSPRSVFLIKNALLVEPVEVKYLTAEVLSSTIVKAAAPMSAVLFTIIPMIPFHCP